MGKIAIVGVEGSGKTVLMAALCECYRAISETEPYLMPENQSAFVFMQQVPHKLRVDREWPGATGIDALRTMKWTLRRGKEIVKEIEMLDYPGELYRLAFGERKPAEVAAHRAELDEFLGHLTDAEILVVLFNLSDLESLGSNAQNAEAVWITRGILDFAQKLPNLKRRMQVFTQADRYASALQAAGGPQGLFEKDLPMLKVLHPDLTVTAIAAVDGTDSDGRPKEGYSSAGCQELLQFILRTAGTYRLGETESFDLGHGVTLEMVWCPPECITVLDCDQTAQQKPIQISNGFFIGKYPVTQRQWEVIMGQNPSHFKKGKTLGMFGGQTQPDHPVENVSWHDCQTFLQTLNKRLQRAVPANGCFRLPYEKEREYAAKGGPVSRGYTYSGGNDLKAVGWFFANSANSTHPVGLKAPNELGLYDMSGNVFEWCQDCYGDYVRESVSAPEGAVSGSARVIRGGSWSYDEGACRPATFYSRWPGDRESGIGFRAAMHLP
jgi:formylglycine-generating enzyme required for sulfatase activity